MSDPTLPAPSADPGSIQPTISDAERIAQIDRYMASVDAKSEELEVRLAQAADAVLRAQAQHAADMSLVGERLLAEAVKRGWCSDFDEFLDNVNPHLTVALPTRTQDYTVTITYEVKLSGQVAARSLSDAQDRARSVYGYVREAEIFNLVNNSVEEITAIDWSHTDTNVELTDC